MLCMYVCSSSAARAILAQAILKNAHLSDIVLSPMSSLHYIPYLQHLHMCLSIPTHHVVVRACFQSVFVGLLLSLYLDSHWCHGARPAKGRCVQEYAFTCHVSRARVKMLRLLRGTARLACAFPCPRSRYSQKPGSETHWMLEVVGLCVKPYASLKAGEMHGLLTHALPSGGLRLSNLHLHSY